MLNKLNMELILFTVKNGKIYIKRSGLTKQAVFVPKSQSSYSKKITIGLS
ncbi:MAG: hypothetical protein WC909_02830 [Candidatus Paceibacterota bacterium]